MFTRRRFLQTLGAFSVCRNLRAQSYPFSLGVASGYPSPSEIVLWTRLTGDGTREEYEKRYVPEQAAAGAAAAPFESVADEMRKRSSERAFDEEVARWRDPSVPSNRVETDGELAADEIALETAQALRDGGPWGQAFPEPCFDGIFAVRNARVIGDKHLKMWVTTADKSRAFDAIAFNFKGAQEDTSLPDGEVRLVYRLDINEYKGERRLQLLVDHVLR